MHIKPMMVGVAVWAIAAGLCSADWYVATNGTGVGTNGWADATNSLLGAVAKAPNNSTIWLSNGTFSITSEITVTTPITIKGYFGRDATVLKGGYPALSGSNRCFTINNASAWLDSLTISNFWGPPGPAIYFESGNITNCLITYNYTFIYANYAAGIYMGYGPQLITDSKISYNSGASYGGAFGGIGSGTIRNCEIYNNYAGNGGACFINGPVTVEYCIIRDNTAYNGGVASVSAAPNGQGMVYKSCLMFRNLAYGGVGGAFSWASNTYSIVNCTIVSNKGPQGGAINASSLGYKGSNFVNCIIYSNMTVGGSANDINIDTAGTSNLFFNCCVGVPSTPLPVSQGNITTYPNFVDPSPGNPNYRLQANSSCIDAGTNQTWMDGAKDLDGRQRLDQWRRQVDIGAYEFLRAGTMFLFP